MKNHLSIYQHQLQSFKDHAYALSDQLSSINVQYRLTGRDRVDLLAQACGFQNHAQLRAKADVDGSRKDLPLALFDKTIGELLALQISRINKNIGYEHARAAIMFSAKELYVNDLSALNTWTAADYNALPEYRPFSRVRVKIGNRYADQYPLENIRALAKIVEEQQRGFQQAMKAMQPTLDLIKRTNLAAFQPNPELMRVAKIAEQIVVPSPAMKKMLEQQETIRKSFATHSLAKQLAPMNAVAENIRKQTAWMDSGFMKQIQRQQKLIERITNPLKF